MIFISICLFMVLFNRFVIVNVKQTQFKGDEVHIDSTVFKVSKTYL